MKTPTDAELEVIARIQRLGPYPLVVLLESGEYATVQRMFYTFALLVGLDDTGYRTRYCYPDAMSALQVLWTWCGHGDPPGPWIVEKGRGDRRNPHRLKDIPIVIEGRDRLNTSEGAGDEHGTVRSVFRDGAAPP